MPPSWATASTPYGTHLAQQGSLGTSKGFTGQYEDAVSGLDYYNARYYDPAVGRFVSADSVQGNAQGVDPYTYVGGNPVTRTDPTGEDSTDPFLIYIYAWYKASHSQDQVYQNPSTGIKRGEVPRDTYYTQWSNFYDTGNSSGNTGLGRPDIVDRTIGVIWEVKTGGGSDVGAGMGSQWPSDYTAAYGVAQAQWYVERARRTGYMGTRNWQVGTTNGDQPTDPALADAMTGPNCSAIGCIVGYTDGTRLLIRSRQNEPGLLGYRVLQDGQQYAGGNSTSGGSPSLETLSSSEVERWTLEYYNMARFESVNGYDPYVDDSPGSYAAGTQPNANVVPDPVGAGGGGTTSDFPDIGTPHEPVGVY